MSIAQFDSTSATNLAAQVGAASAHTASGSDFARLLNETQLQTQENELEAQRQAAQQATQRDDTRRADAAAASADQNAAASSAAEKKADASDTKSTKSTDDTDKSHAGHHAHRKGASDDQQAADASSATDPTATPPAPQVQAQIVPASSLKTFQPTGTDGTDDTDSTDASATGSAAQTADGTGSTATGTAAAADAAALADPAITTLAALGLGRSALSGTGANVLPATGKTAIANVSVTRAPAAVRLSALTTALPQEIDGDAAETPNPTTVTLNPAAASAAANAAAATSDDANAPVDPNAQADPDVPAQTALPADFAAALATATATAATTDPSVTIAATTTQHSSLFAQSGTDDATTGLSTQTSGVAPTTAGFATVNAGTTVSRADTAETPTQNGQAGQTPLPLPAEQLAVAISRNAGQDGSQNFTIKLSPEKLGSVEVQLKVDSKGKTTANFVVEHAETLGLLKQDSQQLIQSLQNAGVDTNGASLSFSLRDPNTGTAQNQSNGGEGRQTASGGTDAIDGTDTTEQPTLASNRLYDLKA